MTTSKKWAAAIALLAFLAVAGYGMYQWLRFDVIDGVAILSSTILLMYLLNWLNWGDHNGASSEDKQKHQIETKSVKVSYYILMIAATIILFVSEGVTDIDALDNYPLILVVGLTFITLPLTEFIYLRKNKK